MSDNLPAKVADTGILQTLDYTRRELLDTLKKTVAKDTSDAEFQMFIELCRTTGLNPLQKQLWCIKNGPGVIITAGINGFMEVANRSPQYDGMEIECDNPENPKWVKCSVYRKDRSRPHTAMALLKEYKKSSPIWNTMPYHMLSKVAKAIALRESFSQQLSGIYIQEEIEGEPVTKVSALKAELKAEIAPAAKPEPVHVPNVEQLEKLCASFERVGVSVRDLEERIGNPLENATDADLEDLRRCYKAIKGGEDPGFFFSRVEGEAVG